MAMLKFAMNTRVLMGEGVCEQIAAQADLLGVKTILVVTDQGLVAAGIVERVLASFDSSRYAVTVFDEVKPDPSVEVVDKGASIAAGIGAELILAVGGGSPIDAGKGIAVVATNGGSSANYEGLDKYTAPPLPLFAVPTTCGTGAEVTFGAVLTDTSTDYKFILYGYNCAPQAAFLDPTLLLGMPPHVMAPTAMDALTHAVESYLSKGATPQSRPLALEAIRIIGRNIVPAYRNTSDRQAMSAMLYASNIAGIAFACSRLGVVHAMALPLGAFFHVPHGIANAILLPHGLQYNLGYNDPACRNIAEALGVDVTGLSDADAAQKAVDVIRKMAADVGIPSALGAVGVTEDKIPQMAADTMKSSHIPANPRPILAAEVAEIYRLAL